MCLGSVDCLRLVDQLKVHEGFRGRPYRDSRGVLTIGYGRNLDARPLGEDECSYLLERDLAQYDHDLKRQWPGYKQLDTVRQAAVLHMAYNLGVQGLMGFRRMRAALDRQMWELACDEAMDSRWANQVGRRARELAWMLQFGKWPDGE